MSTEELFGGDQEGQTRKLAAGGGEGEGEACAEQGSQDGFGGELSPRMGT